MKSSFDWIGALAISILVFSAIAMTAGCTSISSSTTPISSDGLIARDFRAANNNGTNAISLGILPENDALTECIRADMKKLGIDSPDAAAKSFTPERVGFISELMILHIEDVQLEKLLAFLRAEPDPACDAAFGRVERKRIRLQMLSVPGAVKTLLGLP